MPSHSPGQWWVKVPTSQTTCWKLCLYIPLAAPKHNSLTVCVGCYCKRAEVGRELGFMLSVAREADIQKTQRVLYHSPPLPASSALLLEESEFYTPCLRN